MLKNKRNCIYLFVVILILIAVLCFFKNKIFNSGKIIEEYGVQVRYGEPYLLPSKLSSNQYTDDQLIWKSENPDIVKVDDKGNLEILKNVDEIVVISVESKDKKYFANFKVKVLPSQNYVKVSGLNMEKNDISLKYGQSEYLNLVFEPTNATNKKVTWISSDPSFVSVENGAINILEDKLGEVLVFARSDDGNYIASCNVRVVKDSSLSIIEDINFLQQEIKIKVNENKKINYSLKPENAFLHNIEWTSSDSKIVSVSSIGEVTGVKKGVAIITAKINDNLSKNIVVNVEEEPQNIVVYPPKSTIDVGNTIMLYATISPKGLSDQKITWTSSNSNIATVNSTGLVKGLKSGTVTITAKTSNGKSSTATITVENKSEETIKIELSKNKINVGESFLIKSVVTSSSNNKTVTWSSSDSNVVSIDKTGLVKAINPGVALITAKTVTGKTATTFITVSGEVESLEISPSSSSINVGSTITLKGIIRPENAVNKNVKWSSNNTRVATVNSSGVVTGLQSGTAIITAVTDNGKTSFTIITVNSTSFSLSVVPNTGSINVGSSINLSANISPSNSSNTSISWSTSNASIATVSNTGLVRGLKAGTVTITATASNGTSSYSTIVVNNPPSSAIDVSSISLSPTNGIVNIGGTLNLYSTITPSNATNKSVVWSSSNSNVAVVDNSGVVTGKMSGVAIITAKTNNGKTATATITVKTSTVEVSSISVTPSSSSVMVGSTLSLKSTIYPSNATSQNVTWSTSDASIATVSNTGLVKGLKAGKVTITAKTSNGKTATSTISVTLPSNASIVDVVFLQTQNSDYRNGESIIIKTPTDKVILVDVAQNDDNVTNNIIVNGLYNFTGKYEIDYLIISHDHADHRGGLKSLLKNTKIKVKNVVIKNDKLSALDALNSGKTSTYDFVKNNASKYNYNVITTNNLSEGYALNIDDYVTINLFNVQDVYSNVNKCNVDMNIIFFLSDATKKSAAKTETGKYIYTTVSDAGKFNFTDAFSKKDGYYWAEIKSKPNCTHNSNSLALLVDAKTSVGSKYVYIPNDLQNDGYQKYGEYDQTYNDNIYGTGAAYGYMVNDNKELLVDKKGNLIEDPNIIKIPSEYKVAKSIKNKLGSNISNIVLYQESHHGLNNAQDALKILNLNRSGVKSVALYYNNPKLAPSFRLSYPHLKTLSKVDQYYIGQGTMKFTINNGGSLVKVS